MIEKMLLSLSMIIVAIILTWRMDDLIITITIWAINAISIFYLFFYKAMLKDKVDLLKNVEMTSPSI
ncbi:hypothetical protein [Bacillus sp. MUM 13]|uniref:hypothetical protein n=1 Tax=Bacillus sp. MUM 13 TaxID=1678001 RepID=UPI0008F56526|nr:hypothetical protein [Bacillus sp. MUM 13]OIK10679.1 hypothetical protein BIV59_13980 [Bacillus sp. MUM 13]